MIHGRPSPSAARGAADAASPGLNLREGLNCAPSDLRIQVVLQFSKSPR